MSTKCFDRSSNFNCKRDSEDSRELDISAKSLMHQKLETMVGFQYEYGSELLSKRGFFMKYSY